MKKKELGCIPWKDAPISVDITLNTSINSISHVFTAEKFMINNESIICITFYSVARSPEFRVFIRKDSYVSQRKYKDKVKWSSAKIEYLLDKRDLPIESAKDYQNYKSAIPANKDSINCINKYLNCSGDAFINLEDYQKEILNKKLKKRHKKITDEIDAYMKNIRPLPKNFEHWVNEKALNFSRYIYYKRTSKKNIRCYCTSCNNEYTLTVKRHKQYDYIKHNSNGKCPICKKQAIFKAEGKAKFIVNTSNAAILQKTDKGIVIRYFFAVKRYIGRDSHLSLKEYVRTFIEGEDVRRFEWDKFKQTVQIRWCNYRGRGNFSNTIYDEIYVAHLYTRNINAVLKSTEYKYSCLYELVKNSGSFYLELFFYKYNKYPFIEYLIKLKLYKLAIGLLYEDTKYNSNLNLNGKNFTEILKLDRRYLEQLQQLNGNINILVVLQALTSLDKKLNINNNELIWLAEMSVGASQLIKFFRDTLQVTTIHRTQKYIQEQALKYKNNNDNCNYFYEKNEADLFLDWQDYLSNCKFLGFDLSNQEILFPEYLSEKHDEIQGLFEVARDEQYDKAIQGMYGELSDRYRFKYKDLILLVPKSAEEIITEGKTLRHCVWNSHYIKSAATGDRHIFFVRNIKEQQQSYYTMEFDPYAKEIIQCRGYRNCSSTEDVNKFNEKWLQYIAKNELEHNIAA